MSCYPSIHNLVKTALHLVLQRDCVLFIDFETAASFKA